MLASEVNVIHCGDRAMGDLMQSTGRDTYFAELSGARVACAAPRRCLQGLGHAMGVGASSLSTYLLAAMVT